MDIFVPIGILLGASGLAVGCALATLVHEELPGLARHLELARVVLFMLCAIASAMLMPNWTGIVLVILMFCAFMRLHTRPSSDMIAPMILAFSLLVVAAESRSYLPHLVGLVFLFGVPAGSLFVYQESITKVCAAFSRIAAVHGPYVLGTALLALIISSL